MQSVFLVGLMGAGKTTVGRILARKLKSRFVDSDQEISLCTGVTIPTIFEIEGETGFRRRESALIERLTGQEGIVLSTGGGVVLDLMNREYLRSRGIVVYLAASPETLHERTRRDKNRPLLQVDDRLKKLRELFEQRDPLYREIAHIIVEVGRTSAAQVVRQIQSKLNPDANA